MKILSWLFNFMDKYYELSESYENSRYPFFRFLLFIITAALPTLMFLGASAIGFGEAWLATILLIIMAFMLLIKTPKDLFILSLVAINHGIWILVDRKKVQTPDEENLETTSKKKKRKVKWENSTSNPVWDFIIGVLGMILAVVSVVLPFAIFFNLI